MPYTPEQKQEAEDLNLISQGLILLLEKVKLNKSIIDLEGNKTEDTENIKLYYNRTMLRIETLKLQTITKLVNLG